MATYRPLSTSPPSASPRSSIGSSSSRPAAYPLRDLELDNDAGESSSPKRGRVTRSSTVTSFGGFEFRNDLLPLTLSGENEEKGDERHVSMIHGIGLIMGTQVGSGIFSSPGVVVANVGSPGASLLVWAAAAGLAWTGASSFVELGCAIPISGGAQAYLGYSFGPIASYLFTWTAVSTIKPGSAAIISLIFGEYINRMIYHAITADPESIVPEWTFKITGIVAVILVTAVNLISRSAGSQSSLVITIVKTLSLVFVGVLGMVHLIRSGPGPALRGDNFFRGTSMAPSAYAIALYSGLWAFDGWDACCYVAGEMKDVHRDLPLSLHLSMSLVSVLFLLCNVAYFVVLDPETVAATNTVALDFGRVILGRAGAVLFSVLVSISAFGALNASFFTTSRLIYASARDHFLPSIFARLHPSRRTPDNAVFLQGSLTVFFIIFGGGFRTLLNFFSVTSWTFFLLTVLGLLVLRVKEPNLERPYKTWITTPIIFCLVAAFLLLMPIFAAPWEAFAAFMFMSAGVPMYYLTAVSRSNTKGVPPESGIKAVLHSAWSAFRADIIWLLPSRWTGSPTNSTGLRHPIETVEEHEGMLNGDGVEMSERARR